MYQDSIKISSRWLFKRCGYTSKLPTQPANGMMGTLWKPSMMRQPSARPSSGARGRRSGWRKRQCISVRRILLMQACHTISTVFRYHLE